MKAWHVGVTLGDPAGIGPEVTELALKRYLAAVSGFDVTLFGPAGVVEPMGERLGARVRVQAGAAFGGKPGEPSAASGKAALEALDMAISAAQDKRIDALVTAPISKQALSMAGSKDLGHTEILARHLGRGPVAMGVL